MVEPSRKLSSEEVNALMEGLKSGDLSASTTIKDGKEIEYKTFQFGSDDLSLLGDYYALRLINERFARTVRSVFLPLLRVQPRISSFPPEVKSYEEYSSGLDAFMSMTNSRIDDIVYPLQTLKPVSSLLRSRVQSDVVETNLSWRDKLEKAVLEVPLKVQSNLSEPVVSMSKLLRIKEGDTLNINVDDTVDFYVSNQKYFKAEMGEVKGNASVKLTKRLKN